VLVATCLRGGPALGQLVAFPGAEGAGAFATGGRGGDVYHVTSLADTLTPGTLRYGLQSSQVPALGRTIVFDVGGTINLTADLDVKNIHNVTIAGQTAPGHGITVTNQKLQVTSSSGKSTNDIIIRYIASRRNPAPAPRRTAEQDAEFAATQADARRQAAAAQAEREARLAAAQAAPSTDESAVTTTVAAASDVAEADVVDVGVPATESVDIAATETTETPAETNTES